MIKQCKGKDLNRVPTSKLGDKFYHSIKYDGHYVQIHMKNGEAKFYTSGGKEFYHELAAEELPQGTYILEAEFIAHTDGTLGKRGDAAKLTTYRTNFTKGIGNVGLGIIKDTFKVFDIIIVGLSFEERLEALSGLGLNGPILQTVSYHGPSTLEECQAYAKAATKVGYEGLYLKEPSHLYRIGKRVNDAIKLKLRPTADLRCIGIVEGEGKYEGLIGSLTLSDLQGRVVNVGSGLTDTDRNLSADNFIGRVVEIEYEQIMETYIQPTYVRLREEKEID